MTTSEHTRARDEPIPADEELFRGLRKRDVDENGDVLESAIDIRGTSCVRAKYGEVARVLNPDRERTGAAVTQPGKLPAIIEPPEGATLQLAVLVVDDPVPDEDAHAEIRIRRAEHGSSRENLKKVKSEAVKQKVLVSIARAMTVRKAPT